MSLSGEHIGEPGNNKPDDEWSIDDEWAVFNAQQVKQDELNARTKVKADEIMDGLYQRFDEYNMPRVIDFDEDRETELFLEYVRSRQDAKIEELRWSPEGLDDDAVCEASLAILKDYYEEREYQTKLFNYATMLIYVTTNPEEFSDEDLDVDEMKMKLLATFQVHYKLSPEWIRFFDDVTPGEKRRYQYPLFNDYVEEALDTLSQFEYERSRRWMIIEIAKEILGVNEDEDDLSDVLTNVSHLIEMQFIANTTVNSDSDRANRNADLWEYGREVGLDNESLRSIISFFEQTYQIEN